METGIGKRIRERRKELGLSQEELAKRMNLKSKSTICKIERGEDNLTAPILKRYAKALETTPTYLMGNDGIITQKEEERAKRIIDLYKHVPSEVLEDAETDSQIRELISLFLNGNDFERETYLRILKDLQRKP